MITIYDSLLLASTKLKTRKIRLIVTVFVSSLIFAGLSFLAFVTTGTVNSLQSFGKEGYGGRYFVQANPVSTQVNPDDAALIKQLTAAQDDLIARKKAEAKRLGMEYEPDKDQNLPLIEQQVGPNTKQKFLNYSSPLTDAAIRERLQKIPGITYNAFQQTAKNAQAIATYRSTTPNNAGPSSQGSGSLAVLLNNKEPEPTSDKQNGQFFQQPKGIETITSLGWRGADSDLLKPFVLPGQSLEIKDGVIPIIAPFSAAEEILGLKSLPETATAAQKLQRLDQVRSSIANKSAALCYRNSASTNLFGEAVRQAQEIEAGKTKKDYVKPTLIYQKPTTACGATTIQTDKRTAEEKKQADNIKSFDTQFNNLTEPEQGIIQIRIVGLSPDVNFGASFSASTILTGLFSSSLGVGWVSPLTAFDSNQYAQKMMGGSVNQLTPSAITFYAEFTSLKQMEAFIKDQTCDSVDAFNSPTGQTFVAGSSPSAQDTCIKNGKVFAVGAYGNSAGAIEQFRRGIWKVARYIILAILIIAALIMMGNVGKIIADSRRETAVFRALGAKRLDISQIYVTYVLLIGLLVTICSLLVGGLAAWWLDAHYSPGLSVTAVITYNAADITKKFSLFGVDLLYLLAIAGLAILAGLISAILPLLTNMRRNPIRDMRDEN